ncbi:MAG: hypothetical protein IJ934_05885 [Acetobacter sp.]|nr:hypothetical protein [Acetobacter sp.]
MIRAGTAITGLYETTPMYNYGIKALKWEDYVLRWGDSILKQGNDKDLQMPQPIQLTQRIDIKQKNIQNAQDLPDLPDIHQLLQNPQLMDKSNQQILNSFQQHEEYLQRLKNRKNDIQPEDFLKYEGIPGLEGLVSY